MPLSSFLGGFIFDFSRKTPQEKFWKWFETNQDMIFFFERDRERIFDVLAAQMHKLNPSLTFEFGPIEDGRREFTISADGIQAAFPIVEALYAAAPELLRWKILKFRQRRQPADISMGGVRVSWKSVLVHVVPHGEKADLFIYLPGFSETQRNTYMSIAFLMLDQSLGEYAVETRIGRLEIESTTDAPPEAQPLETLPAAFDALYPLQ